MYCTGKGRMSVPWGDMFTSLPIAAGADNWPTWLLQSRLTRKWMSRLNPFPLQTKPDVTGSFFCFFFLQCKETNSCHIIVYKGKTDWLFNRLIIFNPCYFLEKKLEQRRCRTTTTSPEALMNVWHTYRTRADKEGTTIASLQRNRCLHAGRNNTTSPSLIPNGDKMFMKRLTEER